MSQVIDSGYELKKFLAGSEACLALFYASWCPFSLGFLPVFENHAGKHGLDFVRILLDGNEKVFDEFAISVYPTVLYFESGRLSRRLDGRHGAGLNENQLAELIESCPVKRD